MPIVTSTSPIELEARTTGRYGVSHLVPVIACWVASTLAATPLLAAATPPADNGGGVDGALASMQLGLSGTQPPHFTLAYAGEPMEFHGLLCYAFGGYNETCIDPQVQWLTPASRLVLPAPGGVPREFLLAYTAQVRFPAMSERLFSYPMTPALGGHADP